MTKTKAETNPPTRPRNSRKTQAIIVSAAQQEFAAHGYSAVGIRDIANVAAVNQNLITRYFGGKLGLFEQALAALLHLDEMFVEDRQSFGVNMARLLQENDTKTVRSGSMMALSIGDPQARDTSQKLMETQIIEPISQWLGAPHAKSRAWLISMLSMGYTVMHALTERDPSVEVDEDPFVNEWMCQMLQAIATPQPVSNVEE